MEKHPSYQTGDINKEGRIIHDSPAGSYRAKVPNLSGENLKRKKRVCGRAWNCGALQKSDISSSQQGDEESRQTAEDMEIKKTGSVQSSSDVRNGQHLEDVTQKRSEQISV